jgi:hypothetical protein
MDLHIFIALIGALINVFLSSTVPCLISKSKQPYLVEVKSVFVLNRQVILTSSLIVAVTIYLALKVSPEVQSGFTELTGLSFNSSSSDEKPVDLRNLINLMGRR